ncbi:MAG TPA: hypothetical protein VGC42_06750, partial [Kofleriaceae bacterium]
MRRPLAGTSRDESRGHQFLCGCAPAGRGNATPAPAGFPALLAGSAPGFAAPPPFGLPALLAGSAPGFAAPPPFGLPALLAGSAP